MATGFPAATGDVLTSNMFNGLTAFTVGTANTVDYTAVLADQYQVVEIMNKATAIAFKIPTDASVAFPVGAQINILQTGASQVTIGGAGVTINATPGLKLRAQWSMATLIKRATDTWVLVGDLSA
jgi:hypothetical protein